MAIPLIPIAAGVGAGMLGQGLLSAFTGEKKPSTSVSTSTQTADVYHAPFEQYQPTTLYAPQQSIVYPSYQIAIDSPHATQRSDVAQTPSQDIRQYPYYEQPVSYPQQTGSAGGDGGAGISNTTILLVALIAAGGLVAYGVLS
ncbi:hypothetical protein KO465_04360 [Candidatus Micrarchaeota archaeon]|jgi:hypothetical protein|nr:hypothetical protein [Candidatus Micrarchaeota archaeon]